MKITCNYNLKKYYDVFTMKICKYVYFTKELRNRFLKRSYMLKLPTDWFIGEKPKTIILSERIFKTLRTIIIIFYTLIKTH